MKRYDVYITVGDADIARVDSMLTRIQVETLPRTPAAYTVGHGTYNGVKEHSGFLLYLGLTQIEAETLRETARYAGFANGQEAVGVATIPADSALVYCNGEES